MIYDFSITQIAKCVGALNNDASRKEHKIAKSDQNSDFEGIQH